MKFLIPIFLVFFLLSCGSEKTSVASEPIVSSIEKNASHQLDTIFYVDNVVTEKQETSKKFSYGSDSYQVDVVAFSLGDTAFTEVYTDSTIIPHTVHVEKYHNNAYQVKVSKNGKLLYNRMLTKKDFMGMGGDYTVKISYPSVPVPIGVAANGWAVFDLWLVANESDYGGIAFFALDETGNLVLKDFYGGSGGSGCSSLQLSDDRNHILTCTTLYSLNGESIKFGRDNMVVTSFLTDSSFVAITDIVTKSEMRTRQETYNGKLHTIKYLHEERDNTSDNLIIYDTGGKKLAGYRYDGFSNELDYSVPMELVPALDKLVLLDEEKQLLYLISISNPAQATFLKLNDLPQQTEPGSKDFEASVVMQGFSGNKHGIYFIGDKIAYQLLKE
ncbi:hypothetical protein [Botryobacter ruber]|uniref:hypothetical protein n=1 Tax=Botryobacter ruber TaxID=2171629 RepID=UPI000E0B317F|nr:hypothetical protein [Botryobacter ruber]